MNETVVFRWLTVIMPGQQPDIEGHFRWQSAGDCLKEAKAFLDHGLTEGMKARGAVAIKAGCSTNEQNEKS